MLLMFLLFTETTGQIVLGMEFFAENFDEVIKLNIFFIFENEQFVLLFLYSKYRFLILIFSQILTEYVAIEPRVSLCMCVLMLVCVLVCVCVCV